MNANKIRLNNLFSQKGYPMYVEAIFRDTVYLNFEGNEGDVWEEDIKDLVPIPLTEEILLKAGLCKSDSNFFNEYQRKIGDILFSVMVSIEGKFFFIPSVHIRWSIELKSVHQLQNLFFALTCEEIKIYLE